MLLAMIFILALLNTILSLRKNNTITYGIVSMWIFVAVAVLQTFLHGFISNFLLIVMVIIVIVQILAFFNKELAKFMNTKL